MIYLRNMELGTKCGAGALSSKWLITAAHCLCDTEGNMMAKDTFEVVLPSNLNTTNDSDEDEGLSLARIVIHPDYKTVDNIKRNDIALAKTKKKMTSKWLFMTLCLPGKNFKYVGGMATTGGWGETEEEATNISLCMTSSLGPSPHTQCYFPFNYGNNSLKEDCVKGTEQ